MPETTPNYWPAILGTSIAVLWFIHTGLSIGFSKKYNNYLSRLRDFFNKKPIILPSLIVLISPFILTRLALPEYELTGAFKQVLSIFTFLLGVVIARVKEKSDSRKRDKILANSLLLECWENLKILNTNTTRIQEKVDSPLLVLNLTKLESLVNLIAETQEVNSIKLGELYFNTENYLKPLKNFNFKIRKYNDQLSEKLADSPEDSQQLLPQILEIREKILKIIKVLSSF